MNTFKISLITLIAVTFISCNDNETSFGNKVMKDFESGKYVVVSTIHRTENEHLKSLMDESKVLFVLTNEEVFSMVEIHDKEAKQKREMENWENYFHIDVMFDDFNLLESQHSKEDLLSIVTIPKSLDEIVINAMRMGQEDDKETDKNYFALSEYSFIHTAYTNIDISRMKYKITVNQTDRIAYLTVMKIPDEGYRVTSFIIL